MEESLPRIFQDDLRYVPGEHLYDIMSPQKSAQAAARVPWLAGLFCGVFPYFSGWRSGNISVYAQCRDYHIVVTERLNKARAMLQKQYPNERFEVFVDASPFPEVYIAALAGFGCIGAHGLLITKQHGSLVFIGTIATSMHFKAEHSAAAKCFECGACIKACPTGAIGKNGGVDTNRCLSEITQKKGQLTQWETENIRKGKSVWGCDICQKACPMNNEICETDINEFKEEIITSFQETDISNKELRRRFAGRAFIWRGAGPLKRNMEVINAQFSAASVDITKKMK